MGKDNVLQGIACLISILMTTSFILQVAGEEATMSDEFSAVDSTSRVDPSAKFKKYREGYDITNKHYWTSVIFTGVYGYAIGLVWLLCGIVFGVFLLMPAGICCKSEEERKLKKISPPKRKCDETWIVVLAILWMALSVAASGLALAGNARFHSQAGTVVNIIIETANKASQTIYNTTGAIKEVEINLVGSNASAESSEFLNSTSGKLDAEASEIQRQAAKNRRLIHWGLTTVYAVSTVVIVLNLVCTFALSVAGVLRFRKAFQLLIMFCWFMTTICWLFFGIYFFLDKFSSDTCTALNSFQENPYNNSLSSILPCDELLSAQPVLSDFGEGIYNLVNEVNANISILQATTYPNLAFVCNPLSAPPDYLYRPENCPSNTMRIGDIPKVLKVLTCSGAINQHCNDGEFISYAEYKTVEAYTSSIQAVLDAYPGMQSLVECQSVKDAFSEILLKHCRPLKLFARMVWSAMLTLGVLMILLVVIWTVKYQTDQHNNILKGSVKPHSGTADMLESGHQQLTIIS